MICSEHEARIHEYLDNELSPVERVRFEEHLAVCPGCQQQVASARALFAALGGLQPVEEPAGFRESVLAGLPFRAAQPIGQWVLAAQLVLTMALLALAYPLLATWYERVEGWLVPGWLSNILADLVARSGDAWAWLVSTFLVSIDLTWPRGLGLAWPQAALLALALFGLWWLGNRLLLATEANHNGGAT